MDLGSLNLDNIENILGSMSEDDVQMLKNMAQGLLMSAPEKEEKEKKNKSKQSTEGSFFDSFNLDFDTISKIMSFMDKMRSRPEDPRCNLLLSLKPMLSEKRQGKIDDAVKIISLLSFLPIIEELGGKN